MIALYRPPFSDPVRVLVTADHGDGTYDLAHESTGELWVAKCEAVDQINPPEGKCFVVKPKSPEPESKPKTKKSK